MSQTPNFVSAVRIHFPLILATGYESHLAVNQTLPNMLFREWIIFTKNIYSLKLVGPTTLPIHLSSFNFKILETMLLD